MKYSTKCDLGNKKRSQNEGLTTDEQYVNEDSTSTLIFEDIHRNTDREIGLFVVADGAGGEDAGDVASYLATSVISEKLSDYVVKHLSQDPEGAEIDLPPEFQSEKPTVDPTKAIEKAIQAARARIVEYAQASETENANPNDPFRAYTTVVAAIYDGEQLHYGWVGDSQAYVINTEAERIAPLTKDHSEVQELEDSGAIDETEALVHPQSNRISRAVGGTSFSDPSEDVEVDTGSVPLYADDVVLFTSDGLIDAYPDIKQLYRRYQAANGDEQDSVAEEIKDTVVTDDDIYSIIESSGSLDDTSDRFVEFANEKGGKDNISIILARGEGLPATPDQLPSRGFEEHETEELENQDTTIVSNETSQEADPESAIENSDTEESEEKESGSTTNDGGATSDNESAPENSSNSENKEEKTEISEPSAQLVSKTESYEITDGEILGRGHKADIQIEGPNTISRQHAKVVLTDDDEWQLSDNSTRGTYVEISNEWKRVKNDKTPKLSEGMLIALGKVDEDNIFKFQP